jgi:oligoendopeptidase F
MTVTIDLSAPARRFVPAGTDFSSWDPAEAFYTRLEAEEPASADGLLDWLARWSELKRVLDEEGTRRSIASSCDTTDEKASAAYLDYIRTFAPRIEEWDHRLETRYYESPFREEVRARDYAQLDRVFSTNIELFDARNIPLQVQVGELVHEYDEITGGWVIQFEGEERTVPQMSRFMYETDRDLRRRAYQAVAEARLADRDRLDGIYDRLLALRGEMASNAKLPSFRDLAFRTMLRDYTPDDCARFHAAVEQTAAPLLRKIQARRRVRLGLDRLGPYDLAVDPEGRPPLRPFTTVPELLEKTSSLFHGIDPRLGGRFDAIRGFLDLESRKGKAPGGFQATFRAQRHPFIFANLVGLQRDLSTLVHESGHAFHSIQSRAQELFWVDQAGMEFCEVSSMSQELIMLGELDRFYPDAEERRRAAQEQWESVVHIFCWASVIDAFQHWIYTHPGHRPEDRREKFRELYARFMPELDWSDSPAGAQETHWQRQLHLFHVPFYYIEYALAELGALQVYRNFRADPRFAITRLLEAQELGGSRDIPTLFETADCRFDLDPGLLGELMAMVEGEIDRLET